MIISSEIHHRQNPLELIVAIMVLRKGAVTWRD
jgi:hypothetical protein